MKLTKKQITDAACGFVYTEETSDGIVFHRFSKSQEETFRGSNKYFDVEREPFFKGYFGNNCRSSAGVKLDFYSDAKKITVEIGRHEMPNDAYLMQIDTYSDGKLKSVNDCDKSFTVEICKRKREHRITVYLPTYNNVIISGIELSEATFMRPAGKGFDILAYGDSITQGGGSEKASVIYAIVMAEKLNMRLLNQSNSGYVFDSRTVEKTGNPKIVTIGYGINDQGRKNRDDFEKDARDFAKKVRECYPKALIVGILPLWTAWEDGESNHYTAESREILKKVYKDYGINVVNGRDMIPHNPIYLSDGLHPNASGHRYYGSRVAKEIKKLL